MTNLVLIGMPGSGKSTVGAALAALTGREAIDIDARIAEKAGCSIPEIFAKGGEAAFRALEREATAACGALSGADLAAMWAERAPLYERFRDAAIDNSGTVEQTAQAIWRDFCENSGH